MSRQPPNERYYTYSSSNVNSRRNPTQGSSSGNTYSSLGEALGGARPAYMHSSFPQPGSENLEESIQTFTPDGRYNYPISSHPSGMASAYDYATAYNTPYDTQLSHSSLPPMRSTSSLAQVTASSAHFNSPQSTYQQTYSQPQYGVSSSSQQWSGETWPTASQPFHSSPTDSLYVSGRHDYTDALTTGGDPRTYSAQQNSQSNTGRRTDERQKSGEGSSKGKGKDRENAPISTLQSDFIPQIDFAKLSHVYRNALSGSENLLNDPSIADGNLPSLESIDNMLQFATLGHQLLDPHASYSERRWHSADNSNSETLGPAENEDESISQQQVPEPIVHDGQTCLGCGATSTPEWRRGPLGPRTLCNACGLVYAKMIKKRSRELTNFIPANVSSGSGTFRTHDEEAFGSGEDHSGDEHSNTSPVPTKY